ncbi:hypothetical protein K505DRAFT_246348 [Melanomma pulvis-pyrius CBS 109.77]|uniref:Uncharacterized protein n=1 Tax=Melanomma pulvis-pyrius CBS 109.77 TaxID=1314802 RepID=A0A6A6X8A2_9PLEO|nr:hypothetical protein K505DRAFT_246348 [Melanomma pulvis-pyrius CBS 109.77]
MPHNIASSVFVRTTLTTCDVFILALGFLDAKNMITPEQLIESAAPWFIDAETVWWRRVAMGFR